LQGILVPLELQVREVILVSLAHKVSKVLLVNRVSEEKTASPDHLVRKVHLDSLELMAVLEAPVTPEVLAHLVQLVHVVLLEQQA